MSELLTEIYQFLFISSIIFILYIISDLGVKMYGRFKLAEETRFVLTTAEKILLLISLGVFCSYLIK